MYEGTSKIYFGAKYFDIYSHEGFFKKFMEMDVMKNLSINFKMFLYQNKHTVQFHYFTYYLKYL